METFLSVFVVVAAGAALIYAPLGAGTWAWRRARIKRAYAVDPSELDADTRAELARLLTAEAAAAHDRASHEETIRACRQILRLDPDDPQASRMLVASLFACGRYDQAREALERHLAAFPKDEAVRLVPAAIACEQGDLVQAREHLDAMDPNALPEHDRALWFNNYAYTLASLKADLDLALEYGQRALALAADPDRQFALRTLGIVHLSRGEAPLAEQRLKEALQQREHLRPGDIEFTHYHLALALKDQDRLPEARRHLEKLADGMTPFAQKARALLRGLSQGKAA
ncbi:MAG: tetratricopeptide repeat protein [Deltaproteobacteria bacterium]|nr:tetratricopeptide repeat protein [Deltaproteobacteria bacterium]